MRKELKLNPVHTADGFVPSGVLIPKTKDGRVLFVLDWQNHWIAGTTDKQEPKTKLSSHVEWDDQGINQITGEIKEMFQVDDLEVQSKWAGHRPLIKAEGSSQELARTHLIEVDKQSGLISILGGKWTIFRKMGEEGVDMALTQMLNDQMISQEEFNRKQKVSTKNIRFIGDYREKIFNLQKMQTKSNKLEYETEALSILKKQFPNANLDLVKKLHKSYGMRSEMILKQMSMGGKKAQIFDEETMLGYAEVEHLLKYEFCTQTMDILARRSRLAFLNNQKARE